MQPFHKDAYIYVDRIYPVDPAHIMIHSLVNSSLLPLVLPSTRPRVEVPGRSPWSIH